MECTSGNIGSAELRERYDHEAESYDLKRYSSPKGRYYELAEAELLRRLCGLPQALVCDVATGTGKNITALAEGAGFVVGADISFKMIQKARQKCEAAGISNFALVQADAAVLPFRSGAFEAVLSTKFFHNVPVESHPTYFREMARIGKRIAVIELMNKLLWLGLPSFVRWLKSGVSRRALARNYFPWDYRRMTGPHNILAMFGFGAGLPYSDFVYALFPAVFRAFNWMFTYSPLKILAPKLFFAINIEDKKP